MPRRKRKKPTKPWQPLEAYWSASEFLHNSERLIPIIEMCYVEAQPRQPNKGEVASWRESVYWLASVLDNLGLGQVWMFIEYVAGPEMAPVDVVLAGQHPDGGLSFAVIELKQWSGVERPRADEPEGLCISCRRADPATLCQECAVDQVYVPAYKHHKKHPAVQVHDNIVNLKTHHSMFDDRYVNLVGASYLHNLKSSDHQWIKNISPRPGTPTFTARTPHELQTFLKKNFSDKSGAEAVEALLERRRLTSLIGSEVGSIVNGYTQFSLMENQLKAVRSVMATVREPAKTPKRVFVISGPAGSGKSLVGLTLLGQVLEAGNTACYVSGGIASRETFKRAATGKGGAFLTLNNVANKYGGDAFDLVLCDEAHRLTERPMSGSFAMRPGESSVSVIITRAKVPVLFIDGDQRLFADEVWSPEALVEEIHRLGAEVVPISLDYSLRAVGSPTYTTWVRHLLANDPLPWRPDDGDDPEPFQLCYSDSAAAMESFLRSKEEAGESARMSAGICWKWDDRTGTDPEVTPEPGWARPWNAGDQHSTPGVPKRRFWATEPGGFGQIGCVHTAQGLEYEWGGVIMGRDLTWDGSGWKIDRDHVLSKAKRIGADDDLSRAIGNAYRVLMTRSIRGTVLYSVDPATRQLFADLGLEKV
jgi:hypothetical protein